MKGQKRVFTEEEKKFILENIETKSIFFIKNKLNCSWLCVANFAKENGFDVIKIISWTEEEIEALKSLAKTTNYIEIAEKMGKTKNSIYLKARKLGISIITDKRKWTEEDEEYLKELWGRQTIEKISQKMDRTVLAIKVKATELGLGRMSEANFNQITASDVSKILNIGLDKIVNTWLKLGLKLRKKRVSINYSYYCISIENLLIFLKEHQYLWNSKHLEKNILGAEPEWLIEKRKKDLIDPPNLYQIWTKEELKILKDLLLRGYDYDYIATKINRTPKAIQIKVMQLGLSYRLKQYWKGSEIKFIIDNYPHMTAQEISGKLNRTKGSVTQKAYQLKLRKYNSNKGDNND